MTQQSVVVLGLPGSGKTTYLAALWHLVFSRETGGVLTFDGLARGSHKHLNNIADRWRNAQKQDRTKLAGSQLVTLKLKSDKQRIEVTFPDTDGEAYQQMWEDRECQASLMSTLEHPSVLLFIHASDIKSPVWIMDVVAAAAELGDVADEDPEEDGADAEPAVPWTPDLAPTQVQVVGLLGFLHLKPLDVGKRKLAVMLSAWDTAEAEGLPPKDYLKAKLPFLWQYLEANPGLWDWCVYGVSAQGGEYDEPNKDADKKPEAQELRAQDEPSRRIVLTDGHAESNDLTIPLAWLMSR